MTRDAALLDRLRAGDLTALQTLRSTYAPRLEALAMRVVSNRTIAEEIVADACTDFALEHAPRLRDPRAISSYLRLMTVRRARRRMGLARKHAPCPEDLTVAPMEDALIARLDSGKRGAWLAACLGELPARTQRMLRRRFHRDETMAAIARALSVSKQLVSRDITRALVQLRRCLARRAR